MTRQESTDSHGATGSLGDVTATRVDRRVPFITSMGAGGKEQGGRRQGDGGALPEDNRSQPSTMAVTSPPQVSATLYFRKGGTVKCFALEEKQNQNETLMNTSAAHYR